MGDTIAGFIDWAVTEPEAFYLRMIAFAVGCFLLAAGILWFAVWGNGKEKEADAS